MKKFSPENHPSRQTINGHLRHNNSYPLILFTLGAFFLLLTLQPIVLYATDPIIKHSDYQQIYESPGGSGNWVSGFTGPLPFRLVGVVLNDSEDWLDPTAHYTEDFTPWYLGGQAEIFVQAVNLDGTGWDPDPYAAFNDFGGTACWMGQNYGNLPWIGEPEFNSYKDDEWYDELDRLQLWHPDNPPAQPLRKGDLVEINTSVGGMYYNGKMNVNEQHSTDWHQDFDVVVLQRNYGLPAPAELTLSDLKKPDNTFIFNSNAPRDSGAEHYQMSLVKLNNVRLVNPLLWGPNMDLKLIDGTGRDIDVHLGLDAGFYSYTAPTGTYNVTGVIDQESADGRENYRLLALEASSFSAVSGVAEPVWNGGGGSDARWSISANWSSGSINGRELHFDGDTSLNSINDFQNNTSFAGIVFNPGADQFNLSGNPIKVNRVANFSGETQIVDLPLNTDDANCLFLANTGSIMISKAISGSHGLKKYGSAALTLTDENTYNGITDIKAGLLILSSGGTIDLSSGIQISAGATLKFNGGDHDLATISGQGSTMLANSADVTLEGLVVNTLTLGPGSKITVAARAGGPLSLPGSLTPVPEPSSLLLMALALSGLTAYGIYRRK